MLGVLIILLIVCLIAGFLLPAADRGPLSAVAVVLVIVLLFHLLGLL